MLNTNKHTHTLPGSGKEQLTWVHAYIQRTAHVSYVGTHMLNTHTNFLSLSLSLWFWKQISIHVLSRHSHAQHTHKLSHSLSLVLETDQHTWIHECVQTCIKYALSRILIIIIITRTHTHTLHGSGNRPECIKQAYTHI
jgi:hypothetical protein